jgi:hypothetical protein
MCQKGLILLDSIDPLSLPFCKGDPKNAQKNAQKELDEASAIRYANSRGTADLPHLCHTPSAVLLANSKEGTQL